MSKVWELWAQDLGEPDHYRSKIMSIKNIWGTAEAEAWARDFTYVDYRDRICPRMQVKPLSESAYTRILQAFDQDLEDSQEVE